MMPKIITHYNRGYGGYTASIPGTVGAYNSIKDVMTDIEVADVYTVELGTNDFSRSIPVGTTADATGKTDSFWGGLKQLYIDLTTKNMNALIILITPSKRIVSTGSTIDWNTANTAGFKLTDYAQALKDFGSQYGLPVIDWFSESGISSRTAPTFLYDGLHPNLDTNKRLGKMVGNKINQYI
jgi:lysophospholipase L1-like esterase